MIKYLAVIICTFSAFTICAQPVGSDKKDIQKKVTLTSGINGSLLQFAQLKSGTVNYKTIPRYSYFLNTGVDINFHLLKSFAPYTGFQIRNLGLITQVNDSIKYKERVYTIGAPLGIKIYTKDKKMFFRAGADIALAINYKMKYFLNDKKLFKKNEFFSDNSSLMQASAFAGICVYGISFSVNYYLHNFYNPSVTTADARLLTFSLGFNIDEPMEMVNIKKNKDTKTVSLK